MHCFKDTTLEIVNTNYNQEFGTGTGTLVGSCNQEQALIIFSLEIYPPISAGGQVVINALGGPYPTKFSYTIFKKNEPSHSSCCGHTEDKFTNAVSGAGVYILNAGVFQPRSNIGLPLGTYKSIARSDKTEHTVDVTFELTAHKSIIIFN